MSVNTFMQGKEGGVKGTVWTLGVVALIVFIIIALFIISPDLVYAIIYRLADFVLGNYGI